MTAESYFPHLQTLDSGEIFSSGAYLSVRASYKDHIKVHNYEYQKRRYFSLCFIIQYHVTTASYWCPVVSLLLHWDYTTMWDPLFRGLCNSKSPPVPAPPG
jgi:hypothetical protein